METVRHGRRLGNIRVIRKLSNRLLRKARRKAPNRIGDDHPASPRTGPSLEDLVAGGTVVESGDKALFRLLRRRGQHQRQQVEALHVILEYPAKIAVSRV